MTSTNQVNIDAEIPAIVEACDRHEAQHWRDTDYRAAVVIGTKYFVKFGSSKALGPEAATQAYISSYAETHPDTTGRLRVPKVIHFFQCQGKAYLVMEYIKLVDPPRDFSQRIVEALRWLSAVPAPQDHAIGPLGGGYIRHAFFKDNVAPLRFSSVEALERYIEEGRSKLSTLATEPLQPVIIRNDRRMFAQSDMDFSNFGVDEYGNTVLMDFGQIALLPESLIMSTMSTNAILVDMAKSLGWSSNSTASLAVISQCLWMMGNETLGLDDNGYPRQRATKT